MSQRPANLVLMNVRKNLWKPRCEHLWGIYQSRLDIITAPPSFVHYFIRVEVAQKRCQPQRLTGGCIHVHTDHSQAGGYTEFQRHCESPTLL